MLYKCLRSNKHIMLAAVSVQTPLLQKKEIAMQVYGNVISRNKPLNT